MVDIAVHGLLVHVVLYCSLRWLLFPWLVRLYPRLHHGSEHACGKQPGNRETKEVWLVSHASAVLSNRVMGVIMALIVASVGGYVLWETGDDILLSQSAVLVPVGRFITGYFIVDLLAMYQVVAWSYTPGTNSVYSSVVRLLQQKLIFIFHHLMFIFFSLTLLNSSVRGGKGDWLIGLVFMFELSTPFLSVHYIQRQIGLEETLSYQINGLLFLVVFFIFRILLPPLSYIVYAHQHHEGDLIKAISSMRWFCNVTSLLGFLLMVYWFIEALQKVIRNAKRIFIKSNKIQ